MNDFFEEIKKKIDDCAAAQEIFSPPHSDDYELIETDHGAEGSTLTHDSYVYKKDNISISIDYQTKDKCRTFQVKPDMNLIGATLSIDGTQVDSYSKAWEDRI